MYRMLLLSLGSGLLLCTVRAKSPVGSAHFVKVDDIRTHYTDYPPPLSSGVAGGTRDVALVFVHGWNSDESVWKKQVPALSQKLRAITIDLPGHGQSDKPAIAYTMDLHAKAIDAVLQDAGVKAAVLVGHSNGTPVIRQFYRNYPEKVRGLVVVDGALRPFGDASFMEKFIAPLRGRDYQETATRFVNGMTAPMIDAAAREKVRAMMLSGSQQVAVSEMEGLLDPALWQENKIDVPVLMILAKQPAWTPEYEQFAHSLIAKLDYQMWSGVSHFIMLDKPDQFNHAVREFVRTNKLM